MPKAGSSRNGETGQPFWRAIGSSINCASRHIPELGLKQAFHPGIDGRACVALNGKNDSKTLLYFAAQFQ
jgi:hypothetical protein